MNDIVEQPIADLQVDDKNQLLVAGEDIGTNEMWNHRGSTEITFEDLKQIPTPHNTESYSSVGHADFVETLYKHSDRLMAPKGFILEGQRYLMSNDGDRMFFAHHYVNNDTGLNLATAGRNSHDKSMVAAVAIAGRVTVCDNLCFITDDGITVFRRHTGDVTGYLNDQIILSMVKATDGWDDMREQRDQLIEDEIDQEEGYRLMGLAKATTMSDKSASRRLLSNDAEWKRIQKEWEDPSVEYEGGNRTLWSWMNAFTYDFRNLKPDKQLPQHASLHKLVQSVRIDNEVMKMEEEEREGNSIGDTINNLLNGNGNGNE